MKTIASELQRLRELEKLTNHRDIWAKNAFYAAAPDMMRLMEHQARLLDAARTIADANKETEFSPLQPARRLNRIYKILDPNQPMSEE